MRCQPHITLHMPFRLNAKKFETLNQGLQTFFSAQKPFQLGLKGFGCFAPRVIYIDVPDNSALNQLQKGIGSFVRKWNLSSSTRKNQGFVPHVTIAFRDLKRSLFDDAWGTFQDRQFDASITVESVHLLKHDGVRWQECVKYPFDL